MFIPPLFVFPGKRTLNQLMNGAPAGAIGGINDRGSGSTDSALFLRWIRHFVSMAGCTKDSPHILLVGGHESHKTPEVVDFAKEHGVILVTFPPHCSHRLQPLDTLNNYNSSSRSKRRTLGCATHNEQAITQFEVLPLFSEAYNAKATVQSAVNGLLASGTTFD